MKYTSVVTDSTDHGYTPCWWNALKLHSISAAVGLWTDGTGTGCTQFRTSIETSWTKVRWRQRCTAVSCSWSQNGQKANFFCTASLSAVKILLGAKNHEKKKNCLSIKSCISTLELNHIHIAAYKALPNINEIHECPCVLRAPLHCLTFCPSLFYTDEDLVTHSCCYSTWSRNEKW